MVNYSKRVGARTKADVAVSKGFGGIREILRFVTAIFMALCMFLLTGCARTEKDVREYIRGTSEIEVPTDSELVYVYYQTYFQDLDRQYAVFQFKTDPLEWLNENAFSEEKNEKIERDFNSSMRREEFPFPEEYIPTFSGGYFWLKTKFVYFIYSPDNKRLTVFMTEF